MIKKKILLLSIAAILLLAPITSLTSIAEEDICRHINKNPEDYSILLEKTVRKNGLDPWSETIDADLGETVFFKIKITNTGVIGSQALTYQHIEDILPANLRYQSDSLTPEPTDKTETTIIWDLTEELKPGESFEIEFSAKVIGTGVLENFASVYCCEDNKLPYDDDTATVNVEQVDPEMTVEKYVLYDGEWVKETFVELGETVYFKVIINNPSEYYMIHFSGIVYDFLPWNIRYVEGSCDIYGDWPNLELIDWENNSVHWRKPPTIMPGDDLTFYYEAIAVECGTGDNLLTSHPEGFSPIETYPGEEVSNTDGSYDESDSATINVLCDPEITVEKYILEDCDILLKQIYVHPESLVTFKLFVNNTGIMPVDITVEDVLPDGLVYQTGSTQIYGIPVVDTEPDIIGNSLFWYFTDVAPGTSIEIIFDVMSAQCGQQINTVFMTGGYDDLIVEGEDSAEVFVLCPNINIDKTADYYEVCEGDLVTYTYEVTNTGNTPLTNVVVLDDQLSTVTYVSGDTNDDGYLDLDETWIYTASTQLYDDTTNVGSVTATDLTGFQVYDEDDVFVAVVFCCIPGIDIDKSVECDVVCEGVIVVFTYTVTNTGECPLTDLVVLDDQIRIVDYVSGDTNQDGWLDIDETWIYTAELEMFESMTNIGNVTAVDESGQEVYAEDSQYVEVISCGCDPAISVDKKIKDGGEWVDTWYVPVFEIVATYKIIVENTGTCDLTNIVIHDVTQCGIDELRDFSITPDLIDGYDIYWYIQGVLQPGETIVITFNATIYTNVENFVYVDAESSYDATPVSDEDMAAIIYNEISNDRPNKPIDPDPTDTETDVGTSPELSVLATDPDGDQMTIFFYDAQTHCPIDTAFSVDNNTHAAVIWADLEYGTTYSWYARAFDGMFYNTSDTWSFTTESERETSKIISKPMFSKLLEIIPRILPLLQRFLKL